MEWRRRRGGANLFALANQPVLHRADVRVGDGRAAADVEALVGQVPRLRHAGAELLLQRGLLTCRLRARSHAVLSSYSYMHTILLYCIV